MLKRLFHIAVIILLLSGCTGGGIIVPAPVNWNAFTTFPPNAALDVLPDSSIVIDFGQEMDSSTIDTETFVVEGPAGQVEGDISYVGNTATFTPLRILALATSYTVTLKAGIKNLAGDILDQDYSWNFRTRDGMWNDPVFVETSAGDANYPKVAVDQNGNAFAAWHFFDGNTDRIYANRYDSQSGWGTETAIDPANVKLNSEPDLAADYDGNAIVVWATEVNLMRYVYSNAYTKASIGWTGVDLADAGNQNSYWPKVAMDQNGNAFAVWDQMPGATWEAYANYRIFDTSWGTPVPLISTTDQVFSPQIAIDSNGNAISVFILSDNTQSNMYANYYTAGAGWGTAVPLNERTGNSAYPSVAVNLSGDAIALWWQVDGSTTSIYANHYSPNTGWLGALPVKSGINIALTPDAAPDVAMDFSGNAIAVWQENDGNNKYAYASYYTAGGAWSEAVIIGNCGNIPDDCSLNIDMDLSGNAVAVWQNSDIFRRSIYVNRYILGSGWNEEAVFLGGGRLNATSPKVAVDHGGRAVVVWRQYDGINWNVASARFE